MPEFLDTFFTCQKTPRYIRFPREAKAWAAIKVDRQEVLLDDGWTDYRGPIHCHSFISHDSMVSFEEILATLRKQIVILSSWRIIA